MGPRRSSGSSRDHPWVHPVDAKAPPRQCIIRVIDPDDDWKQRWDMLMLVLILFSAVRCNTHGKVGFLADWRRLNVLLTRAQRKLILVGSGDTLRHDPLLCKMLCLCFDKGWIVKYEKV